MTSIAVTRLAPRPLVPANFDERRRKGARRHSIPQDIASPRDVTIRASGSPQPRTEDRSPLFRRTGPWRRVLLFRCPGCASPFLSTWR